MHCRHPYSELILIPRYYHVNSRISFIQKHFSPFFWLDEPVRPEVALKGSRGRESMRRTVLQSNLRMRSEVLVITYRLLEVSMLPVRTDQRIENGQYVAAVFEHARKDVAKLRFPFRIFVPLGENRRWHPDIATQLFRGMSAKEQPVKEGRFALWEVQIHNHFGRQHGSDRRHS